MLITPLRHRPSSLVVVLNKSSCGFESGDFRSHPDSPSSVVLTPVLSSFRVRAIEHFFPPRQRDTGKSINVLPPPDAREEAWKWQHHGPPAMMGIRRRGGLHLLPLIKSANGGRDCRGIAPNQHKMKDSNTHSPGRKNKNGILSYERCLRKRVGLVRTVCWLGPEIGINGGRAEMTVTPPSVLLSSRRCHHHHYL